MSTVLREYRERLRAGENPYLELVTSLFAAAQAGAAIALDERRRELASLFAWAVPNARALDVLAAHAPLLECGAGMGYWAALLRARGVDVVACDARPPGRGSGNAFHRRARAPWTAVERASSLAAVRRHRGRTLVLCWPTYDDDAASYHVLRAYRGDTLVYVGEPDEGATGSVRFRRELALNWRLAEAVPLPRWPRLRDTLMVYRRNAVRRALTERDRCFECRRFIATGAIGRCEECARRRPAAGVRRVGRHRVEYTQEMLDAAVGRPSAIASECPPRTSGRCR